MSTIKFGGKPALRNALSEMNAKVEMARKRNILREDPVDARPPGEWKLRGKPKKDGFALTLKKDF